MRKHCFLLLIFLPLGGLNWANAAPKLLIEINTKGIRNIGAIDADGQNLHIFTEPRQDIEYSAVWSPNGRQIAFTGRNPPHILLMNADGTNVQSLTEPLGLPLAQQPTWSPDGKSLAFAVKEDPDPWTYNIYAVDLDGRTLRKLTHVDHRLNWYSSWSPDGAQITYARQHISLEGKLISSRIFVMATTGQNQKQLTEGPDFSPTWSPDGTKVAYIHNEQIIGNPPQTSSQLWVMSDDGNDPHRLEIPNAPLDLMDRMTNPLWLPDGRILFHKLGGTEIYAVDEDGQNLTLLLNLKGLDGWVTVTSWHDPTLAVSPHRNQLLTFGHLKAVSLLQNYPNPFNPETWIPFKLNVEGHVVVEIHNVNGQTVRTLSLGNLPPGVYLNPSQAAYWDGRAHRGQPVASGVYFYTLHVGRFSETRRMLVVK